MPEQPLWSRRPQNTAETNPSGEANPPANTLNSNPAIPTKRKWDSIGLVPIEDKFAEEPTWLPAGTAKAAPRRKSWLVGLVGGLVFMGLVAIAAVSGSWLLSMQGDASPLVAAPTATVASVASVLDTPTKPPAQAVQPSATDASASTSQKETAAPMITDTPTMEPSNTPMPTETAIPAPTEAPPTLTPIVEPEPTVTATATPKRLRTYVVRSGDNLTGIAYRYGTTINAIVRANRLGSTVIYIGQVLVIP